MHNLARGERHNQGPSKTYNYQTQNMAGCQNTQHAPAHVNCENTIGTVIVRSGMSRTHAKSKHSQHPEMILSPDHSLRIVFRFFSLEY